MAEKLTMADIAELAGVTKSTVSRYFEAFRPVQSDSQTSEWYIFRKRCTRIVKKTPKEAGDIK